MTDTHSFLLPFHRSRFTPGDKTELRRWTVAAHGMGWTASLEGTETGLEYAVLTRAGAAGANNFTVAPIGGCWELMERSQRYDPWTFLTLRAALEAVCRTLPA